MFSTTFLGHQGWMFSAHESRILVDPLLCDGFGHDGVIGEVYPPRVIDLSRFPAIDAVLITHEHEDHFNIPTLNRLTAA
jgi:L-ascorbate metabolism protein UlaG (beta-lactamase superfamily)